MAKGAYIGVSGVARKIKKGYIGVKSTTATLKNMVTNGDFSNGTTGWTNYGNGSVSTSGGPSGGSYVSMYSTGGNSFIFQKLSGVVIGHVYYASAYYKKPDANSSTQIHSEHPSNYTNFLSWTSLSTTTEWKKLSGRTTSTIDTANLYLHIPSTNISGTAYLYATQLLYVDLTEAFGAGNEPSKEWCDTNISFFNGTTTIARETPVGVARKIKKAYIGIGGVARPCWSNGELTYYGKITSLSEDRSELAATSVGNYALFGGGDSSAIVDAYNSSLVRSTPSALSVARGYLAAASVGGYALFVGGMQSRTYYKTVDTYTSSLVKGTATDLPTARYRLTAATVGEYALFAGGMYSISSHYKTVYAYSSTLVNSTLTSLDNATSSMGSATVGNCALFAGGSSTGNPYDTVYSYNSSLVRSVITSLTKARKSMGSTSVGNYAIFAGGQTYTDPTNIVDAYNTSLVKSEISSLNAGKYGMASSTLGEYALFAGGKIASNSTYPKEVEVYNASLVKSSTTSLSGTVSNVYAIPLPISTTVGEYALVYNGFRSNTVDAYTVD